MLIESDRDEIVYLITKIIEESVVDIETGKITVNIPADVGEVNLSDIRFSRDLAKIDFLAKS
jgi:hypothetical protein